MHTSTLVGLFWPGTMLLLTLLALLARAAHSLTLQLAPKPSCSMLRQQIANVCDRWFKRRLPEKLSLCETTTECSPLSKPQSPNASIPGGATFLRRHRYYDQHHE